MLKSLAAGLSGASLASKWCRVGGGALDCSRAGLRPPLKLDVRFSRIQLSRRRFLLSSDGRDHRNQVHEPILAVELVVRQSSPSTAAPPLVPMRPDPPHQPLVEPVKEPSDVGPFVVVAPPSHDGIELLDQLRGTHRSLASRQLADLVLEAGDRFLPGIRVQRSLVGTTLDLARRQAHPLAPALDLVPEKLEAEPGVDDPRLP